jgi:hypothetical protein
MADRIVVDLLSGYTDGSAAKWPQGELVWAPADTLYQERLADLAKELIQGSRHGKSCFILFSLPIFCPAYFLFRKATAVVAHAPRL